MATTTTPSSRTEPPEPRIVLPSIGWNAYVNLSDALGERRDPKLVYLDGSLVLVSPSRRHEWIGRWIGDLVVAVANGCGVLLNYAGATTYRREDVDVGVEPDDSFYLGENAERMRGPQNVDLAIHPPPDLVIEVEVTHPADRAMTVHGRLGVPEVWRIDVVKATVSFWLRRDDGTYEQRAHSLGFPLLGPTDVLDQMQVAETLGFSLWYAQLGDWVRDVLIPRIDQAP